ncbi:MAG: methionyl-tRNA formyltransferase [Candidatus Shapirobacteria bacterium]|nr:methionyl-tRNA formyltransferase [Candidatus Shapirobacteria bacterium]
MINIIFFGSSSYSVVILQKLLEIKDFQVSAIFSKTDKPVGRHQEIIPNPVAAFSKENHLPLFQIEEFTPKVKQQIRQLNPDLALCVAFGPPYFDQETIDIPKYKIVNIHPSPLPKYRGATPGPWQIINGETKSAVSFFQIDALPDHGPIISQLPFDISPTETATTFYQKAFELANNNLESILKNYVSHPASIQTQDHSQKTYFPKFDKDKAEINWSWDQAKITRFVRALKPWPIAWTYVTNQKGQQLKMKVFSFNTEPVEVQIEGKTITNWSEISSYYTIKKS